MANAYTILEGKLLARGLMALRERSIMARLVNSGYDSTPGGRGSTVTIPIPSAVTAVDVAPAEVPVAAGDLSPSSVTIEVDTWKEAAFTMTDKERTEVSEQVGFLPMQASEAIKALANAVENDIITEFAKKCSKRVGTAGTTPFAADTSAWTKNARKALVERLSEIDPASVHLVLDTDAMANALELTNFQRQDYGAGAEALARGQMSDKLGASWFENQLVQSFAAPTGYLTDGAAALGGTTINVDTGTGLIKAGATFVIAGSTTVHVAQNTGAAKSGTHFTLHFLPGVTTVVAANTAMTFTAHTLNMAFHRDGLGFVSRPLASSGEGDPGRYTSMVDPLTGLSLRLEVTREFKQTRYSYDILYGVDSVRDEFLVGLYG